MIEQKPIQPEDKVRVFSGPMEGRVGHVDMASNDWLWLHDTKSFIARRRDCVLVSTPRLSDDGAEFVRLIQTGRTPHEAARILKSRVTEICAHPSCGKEVEIIYGKWCSDHDPENRESESPDREPDCREPDYDGQPDPFEPYPTEDDPYRL
jgi:hypothetical protein